MCAGGSLLGMQNDCSVPDGLLVCNKISGDWIHTKYYCGVRYRSLTRLWRAGAFFCSTADVWKWVTFTFSLVLATSGNHKCFLKRTLAFSNTDGSRYTRLRYPRFGISVVSFQYHAEYQYPIRGQGRSFRVHPPSCVLVSPTRITILIPGTTSQGLSWRITQKI